TGEALLEVAGLTRKGEYRDISFDIRSGQCVAIVGTIGSGRESLVRALFGAEPFDSGAFTYQGKELHSWSATQATRNGMGYVPAERRTEGMVGGMTGPENMALARNGKKGLFVNPRRAVKLGTEWYE
ncbi:ATP-binding cassette domain-containing protein, partial [Escherichia coli]|uniref:ATP-binding cassette domain-containing protein n=1 Tax=Escherichia coli TaxID=562 RepID=UPI00215879A2